MEDWRRIDIDAFDSESRLSLEDLRPEIPAVPFQQVEAKCQQIRGLISQGGFDDAIAYLVEDPPFGADQAGKNMYNNAVIEVLTSVRQSEVSKIIKELSIDQQDVLVKYLYQAMASKEGQRQSGVLLGWLGKTVEIAGTGPINRYLSDRRI